MNPISLIRRYSGFASAASVCAAVVAAPYLTPVNPDSAVFRSGTLGAILLLAAYFPVKNALDRHSLRTLLYGSAYALIFALCMGVGCEMSVYDGLLPGMGSLVRRFAVPVLAAPLLGALFSYVFAYSPARKQESAIRIPYIAFFLLFAACYSAILLALYPGVISYDFAHEHQQYTTGQYLAAHPVFHTLFLGSIYRLGEMIGGSMTAGAAAYSMVQLLLLAAMYAYACVFVQRRVRRPLVVLALTACFAFLPFHGTLAVSTAKDPLFSGLCVLLCAWLWEIIEVPEAFLASRVRMLRFIVCCLLMALLRHNSVFATVPACIVLPFICKSSRMRALGVAFAALLVCLLVPRGLEMAVGAEKIPSSEMMSIPCQQLFRTAEYGGVSEAEYEEINTWFSHATVRYKPHCADPAKGGNFDFARYQAHPEDYWAMYLRYAKAHPRVYVEAFLANSMGIWYPGDTSHAHSLSGEEMDFIYLNTVYPFPEGEYAIEPRCLFPALREPLYRSMHHSDHERYAFYSALFCPATYTFLMLLCTMLAFCRREKRKALCLLPLWGIFFSILFSAGVFVRYAYPMMAAVPVLLCLMLWAHDPAQD